MKMSLRCLLKAVALTTAIGAIVALVPATAGALPLAQAKVGAATGDSVLLVREACGPGRQYSVRLRRCVVDTPRARVGDVARDVRCSPGFRFSDRLRRCVR